MEIYEIYIVKEEDFTEFTPNILMDGVTVKVNDTDLDITKDEFSIEDYKIIFNNPLTIGDKVTVTNSILNNTKVVTKSSYDKNALIRMFSSDMKFKYNHEYDFNLVTEDKTYDYKFTTKYDPLLSNVKTIRADTGGLLDSTSDEMIALFIYKNSKDAMEMLGDGVDEIPTYAKHYVRYLTDLDLCQAFYTNISGMYGEKKKSIGDIEITTAVKLPYIKDMMLRFKELLKPLEDLMAGDASCVASFVKGNKTTYPVPDRGVF